MSSLGAKTFEPKKVKSQMSKRMKKVSLIYQNVRGLRSKTNAFLHNVSQSNYDIIALTETFLTSSVMDGELFPMGYTVVRKDRAGDSGWGGVLLAVRDCFSVRVIEKVDGLTPDMELIMAVVNLKGISCLFCVVYLPPNYNNEQYLNVLTCIENVMCDYPNINVLVLGDFNLNSCSVNVKMNFNLFCDFCNLKQCNNVLNRYGGMLDLVLSDLGPDQVTVSAGLDALVPIDQYHPVLEVLIKFSVGVDNVQTSPSTDTHRVTRPNWNWRKADLLGLYETLADMDWSDLFSIVDVDAAVHLFYMKLYDCIDSFVPQKGTRKSNKHVYPKWYTAHIIQNIKNKHFHLKRYKLEGKEFNKELFKYYRWRVKVLVDNAHKQHLNELQNNITQDPAKFWEYVKDKKKGRCHIDVFKFEGSEVTGQAAADAFAKYFGSVFQDEIPQLNTAEAALYSQADVTNISVDVVNESDLSEAMKRLKARSSSGPDGIPVFIAKDCMGALREPLLYIYNLCLKLAQYPKLWKCSRVTPIPKGDSDMDVSGFRPIAVLSVFAKIFETFLNQCIRKQVDYLLHDNQHGFRKNRSTTTNLVSHVDYVHAEMDIGHQVDAAYLDFRKAFDMVDNDILLRKLAYIGFNPKLLKFFASYLANRNQFVKLDGYESDEYFTRSGVSQGSTLGPTLFLIFINDLPTCVKFSKCLLFADDIKLCLGVSGVADTVALQRDIDAVLEWSIVNRLPFNKNKCKMITFTRKRHPINYNYNLFDIPLEKTNDIRDLGLILDSKLDFHIHVTATCKKASKLLGFVIRTAGQFDNIRVAKILYSAYVRSKLEYGAIIWDPYEEKYVLMIEKIQRKFARWVYKKTYGYYPFLYPSLFVAGMVDLETLRFRRIMSTITFYLAIIHGKIDSPQTIRQVGLRVPTRIPRDESGMVEPRRRPRLLHRPVTRTTRAAHAPSTRALRLLGDLVAQHDDVDIFADRLGRILANFYKCLCK